MVRVCLCVCVCVCVVGAMFGEQTLYELRGALQLADLEREGMCSGARERRNVGKMLYMFGLQ